MSHDVVHQLRNTSAFVFSSLHAGPNSQTWLPGILGLLEGSEPETKPVAPVLLDPAYSDSVLSMGGVSSQLWRGSHDLHSPRSPLTQSGPLQHTGKKHTTLPWHNTQCYTTAGLSNSAMLTLRLNTAALQLLVKKRKLHLDWAKYIRLEHFWYSEYHLNCNVTLDLPLHTWLVVRVDTMQWWLTCRNDSVNLWCILREGSLLNPF